jgi:hypothetical protein
MMTILLFKKAERLTYAVNECQLQKERKKAGFGSTAKKYTVSSECERLFSSAKLLLSDRRARMKEDIIEASECLRYWYAADRFRQK